MAAQVGLYTTLSLAALKAVLVFLEVLFHFRLSRVTHEIHQKVLESKHLPVWHREVVEQLAVIEENLACWHRRFDEQISQSEE